MLKRVSADRKSLSKSKSISRALSRPSSRPLPQVVFAPHVKGKGRITPFIKPKTTKVTGTVGVQLVSFSYEDVGGSGHLLPGFPTESSTTLNWPKGAGFAVVFLTAFSAAYVDESGDLVDDHLGQMEFKLGFLSSTSVGCRFLLRDAGTSQGVDMWANGVVLYFAT
jgi:hypothetical protein